MNKTFKVIFNRATQTWVAVSELAKGHCKSSSNNVLEISESNKEGHCCASLKMLALASAMMMALSPNSFAVIADVQGAGSIKSSTTQGTAIAGGEAKGDTNALAIGRSNNGNPTGDHHAKAYAAGAIAIGTGTLVEAESGVALGYQAKVLGGATRGVAVGASSLSGGLRAVAVGDDARAEAEASVALGGYTRGTGFGSTSVGYNATSAARGVALGGYSKANGDGSIAIGNWAKVAQGKYSEAIVIGNKATANNEQTVVIGPKANSNGPRAIAIGKSANAEGESTVALGDNTKANGYGTMVFGHGATATGSHSLALGVNSTSPAPYSVAIANQATVQGATSEYAIVIGTKSKVDGKDAILVGSNALVKAKEGTAVGSNSLISSVGGTAIGANSKVGLKADNAVALGAGSEAGIVLPVADLVFKTDKGTTVAPIAAKVANSALSVGNASHNRQIVYVAAGRVTKDSTDAVNGSQLHAVMTHAGFNLKENRDVKSRINNDGTVNFIDGSYTKVSIFDSTNTALIKTDVLTQDISVDNTGKASPAATKNGLTTATTVASAINNALDKSGFLLKANSDTGEKITRAGHIGINQDKNIIVERKGSDITIKTKDEVTFTKVKSGTVDADLVTTKNLTVTGTSNLATVNINKTLSANEDVNLGGAGKTVSFATGATINANKNKITNIGEGTAPNDAVNKGQLDKVSKVATDAKNTADTAKNAADLAKNAADTAKGTADLAKNTADTAKGTADTALDKVNKGWTILAEKGDGNVVGGKAEKVEMGNTVKVIAGKNLNITQNGKALTLAVNASPTFDAITTTGDATIGGALSTTGAATIGGDLTVDGSSTLGSVTLKQGSTFDAGGNRLTNLSKATGDNDATTLSQVKDLIDGATSKATNINTTNANITNLNTTNSNITNLNTTNGNITNLNTTNGNITNLNADNVVVKDKLESKGDTILSGDTTIGGAGKNLTIAGGTTVNMGDNIVSGVKDGVAPTDAVNKGQLDKVSDVANEAQSTANEANNTATTALDKVNKGWNIFVDARQGKAEGGAETKVEMGDMVTLLAGKNLNITQKGQEITFAVNDSPKFNELSTKSRANIGGDLIVSGTSTLNDVILEAGSTFDAGGNRLTNLDQATEDNDAPTLSQVKNLIEGATTKATNINSTNANITNLNTTTGNITNLNADNVVVKDKLESKGDTILSGDTTIGGAGKNLTIAGGTTVNMGDNIVSGVKDGVAPTDAVNKGQLDKVSDVANEAQSTANEANNTATTALDKVNKGWNIFVDARQGKAEGGAETKVEMGDMVTLLAGKNLNITQNGQEITFAVNDSPKFNELSTKSRANIGGDLIVSGTSTLNDVVLEAGSTFDAGGNRLTNLDQATEDNDAPTLSQVKNLIEGATTKATNINSTNANITNLNTTNSNITNLNTTNGNITNLNTTNGNITNLNSDNMVVKDKFESKGNTILSGDTTIGGAGKNLTVNKGTTINMGDNIVSGVKDGVAPTDAVNKGQLDKVANNPLTFVGNTGQTDRKLGQTLNIKGDGTTAGSYSAKNVKTKVTADKVEIQIAENPAFNTISTVGNANIGGDLNVIGTTKTKDLNVLNDATIAKNFTVKGNANFDKDVTVKGKTTTKDLNVTNNATVNNLTASNGTITNLTSSQGTFTTKLVSSGDTIIGGPGKNFTVQGGTVVNMGGNAITNIGEGKNANDAATKGQLDKVAQDITQNLATLSDKPLTFKGNEGDTARKLGEAFTISGEGSTKGDYSSKNVKTLVTAERVEIKIAENPEFETISTKGDASIGGGLKVTGTTTTKDLTVTNDANIEKNLTVKGNGTFEKDVKVVGKTTTKDLTVTNNANIEKNLTVKGDSTVKGNAIFEKDVEVAGKTTTKDLTVTNNANIEKNLTVKGDSTVKGNATFEKDVKVAGKTTTKDLTVTNNANIEKNLTVKGDSTVKGNGTFEKNVTVAGKTTTKDLTVTNNANIEKNLTVKGDSTFGGQGKTFTVSKGTKVDMGGNVITNIGEGKVAAGSKEAVTGGQLHKAIQNFNTLTDKGLNFVGNNAAVINRKFGQTLKIQGSLSANKEADSSNIRTVSNAATGAIEILMAKDPTFRKLTVKDNATFEKDVKVAGKTTTKDLIVTNNANIEKNLTVKGDSTVKGNATFEKDVKVAGKTTTKDLTVTNNANIEKNLTVKGDSTVKGNATFEKDVKVSGKTTTKDLTVTNNANIEKNLTVKGDSTVEGTTTTKDLTVTNNATIEKDLTVKGDSTIEGTTTTKDLSVTNNATIEKDLTVKGDSTIEGTTTTKDLSVTNNATIEKDLTVNGDSNTKGNSTIGGNLTVEKDLRVEGKTVLDELRVNQSLTLADDARIDLGRSDITGTFDIYGDTDKKTLSQALTQLQMEGPLIYVDPESGKDVQHRTDVVRLNSGSDKPVRVTNVADPKEANDAVNLGYFNQKLSLNMGQVNNRINRVDRRLRSGIASAVAMALLPQAYRAGDRIVSLGGGTYRGASAIAVGYSRVSDNGRLIIKIGGSANNAGDYAGGAAIGWKF